MAEEQKFDPSTLTRAAEDTFTVRRVFGEAYQQGGATLIPVARVMGMVATGAGGGQGDTSLAWLGRFARTAHDEPTRAAAAGPAAARTGESPDTHGAGHGGGGGFGTWVEPLGVYVVDAKGTRWQPTFDANLVILGAGLAFTIVASTWALAKALRRH